MFNLQKYKIQLISVPGTEKNVENITQEFTAILENINDQTALISVPNCHWTDGGLIDLLQLSNECKNKDIALTIDGTQSVGAMPVDIQNIKPDLLVVSGYKWCLGPYSLGAAYIDKKYHDGSPIEHNWMAKYPLPEDNYVPNMTKYEDFTIENARRFDFGLRGNFHLMPVFEESLSLINRLSPEYIYAYVGKLNEEIIKNIQASSIKDMGKVMGWLKPRIQGRADMGSVSSAVKQRLGV